MHALKKIRMHSIDIYWKRSPSAKLHTRGLPRWHDEDVDCLATHPTPHPLPPNPPMHPQF